MACLWLDVQYLCLEASFGYSKDTASSGKVD